MFGSWEIWFGDGRRPAIYEASSIKIGQTARPGRDELEAGGYPRAISFETCGNKGQTGHADGTQ
jgi:hypothetical protein